MAEAQLRCLHRHYLNNDVHALVLQDESVQAVDDALYHLANILEEHPHDETLMLFIDARAGIPPLAYFYRELKKVYSTREVLPTIRAAYIYQHSLLLTALQAFFSTLRISASRRFIKGGTEAEAMEWLLSDES